jgi:putative oxygen-independent coproporphyrinogen III oxidase
MQSPTAPKLSLPSRPPPSPDITQTGHGDVASHDPLAIYIHWPFCESKCPYCDFNSYAKRSLNEEAYLRAANTELRHYSGEASGRTVTSIFFGGGTPSLMTPNTVASLLETIAELWPVDRACEITLEANPSSVEAGRFAGYRAAGVNRVSLGVQSLDGEQLRFLGRLHSAAEARRALKIAAAHFERVSFDLIYARPGQTEAEWRTELKDALSLACGHLSLYQLTIEPGTAFFDLHRRGKLQIPGAELAAGLYELTQEICEAAGLPAYEVSNHAAPGQESRHNLTYWHYGDYLGAGPGAHGRFAAGSAKIATAAIRAPADWQAQVRALGHGCAERFELSPHEQAEEMVLMGLRLAEGLDLERLKAGTGYDLVLNDAAALEEEGFLIREKSRLRVTARGRLVLNAITATVAEGLALSPVA